MDAAPGKQPGGAANAANHGRPRDPAGQRVLTAGRHQGALPLTPPAVEMLITFAAQAGIGLELAGHRHDLQRLAPGVVEEMTDPLGFAPGLRMAGPLDTAVPGQLASQLLAALREALANAAKHAQASRADVAVEAGADLVLVVRDNGVGLATTGRRSGLANLAERASELGGTLRTVTADGGGTELEWRVPLRGQ